MSNETTPPALPEGDRSNLLDLPAEIRNIIYEFLLHDDERDLRVYPVCCHTGLVNLRVGHQFAPALMVVNRQMNVEYSAIAWRHMYLKIYFAHTLINDKWRASNPKKLLDLARDNQTLVPFLDRVQNVRIVSFTNPEISLNDVEFYTTLNSFGSQRQHILDLLPCRDNPNLRGILSFIDDINDWFLKSTPSAIRVHFRFDIFDTGLDDDFDACLSQFVDILRVKPATKKPLRSFDAILSVMPDSWTFWPRWLESLGDTDIQTRLQNYQKRRHKVNFEVKMTPSMHANNWYGFDLIYIENFGGYDSETVDAIVAGRVDA